MPVGDASQVPQNISLAAFKEVAKDTAAEIKAESATAQKNAQDSNARTRFKTKTKKSDTKLKNRKVHKSRKTEKTEKLREIKQKIKDAANKFSSKNREFKKESLEQLSNELKPGMTKDEIMDVIKKYYHSPSMQDKALEFLLTWTVDPLKSEIQEAKNELNDPELGWGREIEVSRDIEDNMRQADVDGKPEVYDPSGNPIDAHSLFNLLTDKHGYNKSSKIINAMFDTLGTELKNPHLEPAEIKNKISVVRNLQAIRGVYRFFNNRMPLVQKMMAKGA